MFIKCLVCHECSAHSRWDKKSEKYKNWWDKHKATCYINHSGSSDSMETQGAIEMFLRSIDKNGLRYTTFVGDGDSNCYASVCEALKNAPTWYSYEVKKEECVSHIQKRNGTALREYKRKMKGFRLADGKFVSGKGRLTDIMINRIQNCFGQCIRNNKGNLQRI